MEKYNKNLGYHYLKERLNALYLGKKIELEYAVEKLEEDNSLLHSIQNLDYIYFSINYPGLLIGTGTSIEYTGKEDKEIPNFKNGLCFDHTSGLPYIPGSSLKGALRDFFPEISEKDNQKNTAKTEIINEILGKKYTIEQLCKITEAIFSGRRTMEGNEKEDSKVYLPIHKRDKFIQGDVVLSSKNPILEKDYITPHRDILENPVPIQILKIAPNTKLKLAFELHDTEIDAITMSKEEKKKLFTEILFLTGLGAKTNVGYGHFDRDSSEEFTSIQNNKIKKLMQEERKLQEEQQEREAMKGMTEEEKFEYEFKKWNDEEKKANYTRLKEFQGEAQKIIAKVYYDYFMTQGKPNKKTQAKLNELKEILSK